MNAKARKKAKRNAARSHLQEQATREQASIDEAAPDDAAWKRAVASNGREMYLLRGPIVWPVRCMDMRHAHRLRIDAVGKAHVTPVRWWMLIPSSG